MKQYKYNNFAVPRRKKTQKISKIHYNMTIHQNKINVPQKKFDSSSKYHYQSKLSHLINQTMHCPGSDYIEVAKSERFSIYIDLLLYSFQHGKLVKINDLVLF